MAEMARIDQLWYSESSERPRDIEVLSRALGKHARQLIDDPYSSAYDLEAQRSIRVENDYGMALRQFIDRHPLKTAPKERGITASNAINVNRSIVHAYLLDQLGEEFYQGLDTPSGWRGPVRETANHIWYGHDELAEDLSYYFLSGTLQTTHRQRYALLELYMQTLREELGEDLRVLDVGCSLLIGANQLVLKDHYPFVPITVHEPTLSTEKVPSRSNEELTLKSNELLQRSSQVAESDGVDIMDPMSRVTQRLAPASLRIKDELNNKDFMRTYKELASQRPPNVDYVVADFSDRHDMESRFDTKFPGKRYDVVYFSMMAHQAHDPQEFRNMLAMAHKYVKPGGKILLFDVAYAQGSKIEFYLDWYRRPYRFRLLEIDTETGRPTEVLRARNGRCEDIAVHAGITAIRGYRIPTAEAILAA